MPEFTLTEGFIGGGMSSSKVEIGPWDLSAVALVSFVVGAASVWMTEDVSWSLPGTGSGTRADWLAAFGTWVIGAAATCVAVLTFLYTRAQGRGVRSALLNSTHFITADALWLEIEVSAFLNRSEERQKWRHLTKMLKECYVRSETIKIDSAALPYVPNEAHRKLAFINTRLRGLRTLMESDAWKEPEGKRDEFVGNEALEALSGIHSFVEEIDGYCEEFSQILKKAAAK